MCAKIAYLRQVIEDKNIKISGKVLEPYEEIPLNYIGTLKDNIIILVISSNTDIDLRIAYLNIKEAIRKGNRIILVFQRGVNEKVQKVLGLLLVSNGVYDIYMVNELDEIDEKFIRHIVGRIASENEVRTFITPEIVSLDSLGDILMEIDKFITGENWEALKRSIEFKRDLLQSCVNAVNYLKYEIWKTYEQDDIGKELEELKENYSKACKEIEETKEKLQEAINEIEAYKEEVDKLNNEKELLETENKQLKDEIKQLSEHMEKSSGRVGPVINIYGSVMTNLEGCKVKSIIYFKEVSYVRYVASFIETLFEIISRTKRLRIKLLVYDNAHSFTSIYSSGNTGMIHIMNVSHFLRNKQNALEKAQKLFITEPNQAILKEILNANLDVLIIYDKLRQSNDLVVGNNVYKFWVINSKRDYLAIKNLYGIKENSVITRDGVLEEAIGIPEIADYKTLTESKRMVDWLKAECNGKKIIEEILNRAHINELSNR